jgi:DNA-directed RNA polymerase alpha subunit
MKYEYAEEEEDLHITKINSFAANGWELVQVVPVVKYNYMFRRVLPTLPEIVMPRSFEKVYSAKKYMNVNIYEFHNWSNRLKSIFNNQDYTVVGDLLTRSAPDLFKIRNFGKERYRELVEVLAKYNLEIGLLKPENAKSTQDTL